MNMLPRNAVIAAVLLLPALTGNAQEKGIATAPSSTADAPGWAYSVSGSYYSFRDQ
jgi:hypothetical protein